MGNMAARLNAARRISQRLCKTQRGPLPTSALPAILVAG